nr:MAG TPA: hypothetical protein [Caudoviricetes sp.]
MSIPGVCLLHFPICPLDKFILRSNSDIVIPFWFANCFIFKSISMVFTSFRKHNKNTLSFWIKNY